MNSTSGSFTNGVPYLRFGNGTKTLLFLAGGPGSILPRGLAASGFVRAMRGFVNEYRVYLTGRKRSLAEGTTTRALAADVAAVVREDFAGRVDLVMGFSFGGLLIQHLAADHPAVAGHFVIGAAAHRVSDDAKRIDWKYAVAINRREDRRAMATRAEAIFPANRVARSALGAALWLAGKRLLGPIDGAFRRDVLIEAAAERDHDGSECLGRIRAPVLIVAGRDDFAFPLVEVERMSRAIAGAVLRVYPRPHGSVMFDPGFPSDVRSFVRGELGSAVRETVRPAG